MGDKPKFSLDDIRRAQERAESFGLLGWERFCAEDAEVLQRVCNGCGAEWMPAKARDILDKRFCDLEIVFMLHDYGYWMGDGTADDFRDENDALAENGKMVAKSLYAWYSPARYLVIHDARKLARICDVFGWKAYKEAIEDRKRIRGF